jgi:hypothetical protein
MIHENVIYKLKIPSHGSHVLLYCVLTSLCVDQGHMLAYAHKNSRPLEGLCECVIFTAKVRWLSEVTC